MVADGILDSADEISYDGLVGDINNDGSVGTADLLILLAQYGATNNVQSSTATFASSPEVALQTTSYTAGSWSTLPMAGTTAKDPSTAWLIDLDATNDRIEVSDNIVTGEVASQTTVYQGWHQVSSQKEARFFPLDLECTFTAADTLNIRVKIEYLDGGTVDATYTTPAIFVGSVNEAQSIDFTVNDTGGAGLNLKPEVMNNWPTGATGSGVDELRFTIEIQAELGNVSDVNIKDNSIFEFSKGNV